MILSTKATGYGAGYPIFFADTGAISHAESVAAMNSSLLISDSP